jgi:hypothetical protein
VIFQVNVPSKAVPASYVQLLYPHACVPIAPIFTDFPTAVSIVPLSVGDCVYVSPV